MLHCHHGIVPDRFKWKIPVILLQSQLALFVTKLRLGWCHQIRWYIKCIELEVTLGEQIQVIKDSTIAH